MYEREASVGDGPGRDRDDRGLRRLPARVLALIALFALGAVLTAAVLETQAGATAYIIGESHWSKAHQRAMLSLYRYAIHARPSDLADAREALRRGDEVRIVGFGSFFVGTRAASPGRNPRTGERIDLPPTKQPKFRAGKTLTEAVG